MDEDILKSAHSRQNFKKNLKIKEPKIIFKNMIHVLKLVLQIIHPLSVVVFISIK